MTPQKVIIADHLEQALSEAIAECRHDRLFILVDETTEKLCLPVVSDFGCLQGAKVITIGATDANKTLQSISHVWEELGNGGATRHTLLINIGGGMVTDLGGFAASTFKRGIQYINIPTTLLSMVDASVGGKTGINFNGLKNEIGVFNNASSVILDTQFLQTMDRENILSGYAEMLKHGLISNEKMWAELLTFNVEAPDFGQLQRMVAESVAVKQRIVTEDPTEQGIRKALNLGHTVGHAFESFALRTMGTVPSVRSAANYRGTVPSVRTPQLHGYFVAYGLICELYLSAVKCGFPTDKMHQTVNFIKEHYGKMTITCDDYPTLLELMTHDKKNVGSDINFTLLGGIGDIRLNQISGKQEIYEALDFYREC
ncbi:MAG: 3-dehydroquinate synthase [Prevotella sp.]|nr:3-dehydroquinate synthase [Prevotella sp.]